MRNRLALIGLIALMSVGPFIAGCDSEDDAEEEPAVVVEEVADEEPVAEGEAGLDEEPRELVQQAMSLSEVVETMEEDSDTLDAWLEERGMTEAELEELLFEIAADGEASAAYANPLGEMEMD